MKILVFAQTPKELRWVCTQAGRKGQRDHTWCVLLLGAVASDPPTGPDLPANCRVLAASDLPIDGERIWREHRSLQAELWQGVSGEPGRSLHVVAPVALANPLLHLVYADVVVSTALRHVCPDEVRVPPPRTSGVETRPRFAFGDLQWVVHTAAARDGIRCVRHWSSAARQRGAGLIAAWGQFLCYGLLIAYDGARVAWWAVECIARLFRSAADATGRARVSAQFSDSIVFANADTDLKRQFDIRKISAELLSRSLIWLDVERRHRFTPPSWRQYKLADYLASRADSLEATSCTDLRKVSRRVFPTLVTPIMLAHEAQWFCTALAVRKPAGTSSRLWGLLGSRGFAGERFRNWRQVTYAAKCFAFAHDILRVQRPALLVVGNAVEVHRAMTLAARQCGVRTLATAHAIDIFYQFMVEIYSLADTDCRFGRNICPSLEAEFPRAKPQRIVGHDSLAENGAAPSDSRAAARAERGRRVMIVTSLYVLSGSQFTNDLFVRHADYAASLYAFVEALANVQPGVEVTIKSHPLNDEYSLFDEIQRTFPSVVRRHWREPLDPADRVPAEVVVFYNCFSALFFSIVAQGLPVLAHSGALTSLTVQQIPAAELMGSHDSVHLADLTRQILDEPSGPSAQEAHRHAACVYRKFIQPSNLGLTEAVALTLREKSSLRLP